MSSGSDVRPSRKPLGLSKERPAGPTRGNRLGKNFASRPGASRSGGEAAASLDTEVVTQPAQPLSETSDRHNSTAKRLRILTSRAEWLADVKACSALSREQRARQFDARSRAVGLERRRAWREQRDVWRDARTGRTADHGQVVRRLEPQRGERFRELYDPRAGETLAERGRLGPRPFPDLPTFLDREWLPANEVTERLGGAPPLESHWHSSRAKTLRELFERVESCGESEGHRVTLVCRNCKDATSIEVGCGSKWFCPTCRVQQVTKFRKDFEAKRLGIVTAAQRAGLTRRRQARGERWGERLITFTLPHRGSVEERIEVLRATWLRFWRLLRAELLPGLQGPAGISWDVQSHNRPNGRSEHEPHEMRLADLLSYLYVLEWTPGKDDMLGHPHLHVWMFSRYLDNKTLLHPLWERAYYEVRRARVPIGPIEEMPLLVPDVRAANADVAHELVKYLTKDWEVTPDGAKRTAPDIFARVYAQLDGKRLKQSSAGFSKWAVEKALVCPCCGYEDQRGGHWARVDIDHSLERHSKPLGVPLQVGWYFDAAGAARPMPLTGAGERAAELRQIYDAQRDAEFLRSAEHFAVRNTMHSLGLGPEQQQQQDSELEENDEWQQIDLW